MDPYRANKSVWVTRAAPPPPRPSDPPCAGHQSKQGNHDNHPRHPGNPTLQTISSSVPRNLSALWHLYTLFTDTFRADAGNSRGGTGTPTTVSMCGEFCDINIIICCLDSECTQSFSHSLPFSHSVKDTSHINNNNHQGQVSLLLVTIFEIFSFLFPQFFRRYFSFQFYLLYKCIVLYFNPFIIIMIILKNALEKLTSPYFSTPYRAKSHTYTHTHSQKHTNTHTCAQSHHTLSCTCAHIYMHVCVRTSACT